MMNAMTRYEAQTGHSIYDGLGGETGLRALVASFYRHMATDADLRAVLDVHHDLDRAEQRLFEFLSGRFGGPNLYWERHGHPRLRRRHMGFAIGAEERDQWVRCMARAMDEVAVEPELRDVLHGFFSQVAHHMQNRP
jgi:hemoglobin